MKDLLVSLLCVLLFVGGCASGSVTTTVQAPIVVGVTPSTATLPPSLTAQFTATVSNDSAGRGVTWSVACSASQCGSVSPAVTPSATPTTYTAPATAPTGGAITVTATSMTDNTKSASTTVNVAAGTTNADLNGEYAFTFTGFSGSSSGSSVFAAVGRFTADGAGHITNGELDSNGVTPGSVVVAQAFTGTFAIGADHRGVLTLQGGAKLAFAMMANGNAQFIEFDATGGSGTIGSGTMEKVDTAAYAAAKITGDYAFGAAGLDHLNNRAAMAGRFTSNGAGTLTNAAGDVNAYGTVYPMSFTSANYFVSDTATGRGTISLAFSISGAPKSMNFVSYVVNAGKLFAMERDAVSSATPLLSGAVLRQQVPAGGFSNASLNSSLVIYLTGLSNCGSGAASVPKAFEGLLTADGLGAFNLTFDENYCRAPNSVTGVPGTYSVASNGRTAISVGTTGSLGAYLVSPNQAFLLGTDVNVLFGFGEPQATGPLTNAALTGAYAGMATTPAGYGVAVFSGEFTADGASPNGSISGIKDIGSPNGPISGAAFHVTYSVSSSPTNGRGTVSITSGSGGSAVAYMVSPSRFVMVPLNDPNPAVWVFEQF